MLIDAKAVKALRDETGAGMMDCKVALQASDGDHDAAKAALMARGFSKKPGDTGTEGLVAVWSDPILGAGMVEINCTTDFAARTDDFKIICDSATRAAVSAKTNHVSELLAHRPTGSGSPHSFEDVLGFTSALLREPVTLARVAFMETHHIPGQIYTYVHGAGSIGAIVKIVGTNPAFKDEQREFGRKLAMHIAAADPLAIYRTDLSTKDVQERYDAHYAKARQDGKPAHIAEKIAAGKGDRFFREMILTEQKLVMDPDVVVGNAATKVDALILEFKRFELGVQNG